MPLLDQVCMGWWFKVETERRVVKANDSCVDSGSDAGVCNTDEGSRWGLLKVWK